MKAITASLQFYVVQKLRVSNQQAIAYIVTNRILVNGQPGRLQQKLQPEDVVEFDEQVIKAGLTYHYLAYYKPRGIESTLNPEINSNLLHALNFSGKVFPVGRLDKESEGLMLLTNNGYIYNKIINAENYQEKEYQVTVNKPLNPHILAELSTGIKILGRQTRPAQVNARGLFSFNIILTQGLNRQIRRMCYKLGYEVEQLIRTRIVNLKLGNLAPGEWRYLNELEIRNLKEEIY